MKLFRFNFLLILTLFLFACDNKQTLVNYQKPYLDITYQDINQPLNIKMVDYQTNNSVDIDAHNFTTLMPSYLDPYNDDYLLIGRFNCEILVINKNSSSHIFNPCQQVNLKKDANINDGVYYNEKYLLVTFNIGFNENNKHYDYAVGIFNHDYKLIDFLEFKQQPYLFNLVGDKLYFTSMESLYSGFNIINNYDIKTKKLVETKTNYKDIKDLFIVDNNIYVLNEKCDLYLNNKKLLNVSERCANIQNKYQYQNKDNVIYNLLGFTSKSDQPYDLTLEISKNNSEQVKVVQDQLCQANKAWYSPQGKYCATNNNKVAFNDYQNTAQILDINNKQYQEFGFYNWK